MCFYFTSVGDCTHNHHPDNIYYKELEYDQKRRCWVTPCMGNVVRGKTLRASTELEVRNNKIYGGAIHCYRGEVAIFVYRDKYIFRFKIKGVGNPIAYNKDQILFKKIKFVDKIPRDYYMKNGVLKRVKK